MVDAPDAVGRWESFELACRSDREHDDPFDVEMALVVEAGDDLRRVPGFYDGREAGEGVWRARFAPPRRGEWRYRTVSEDPALDGHEGRFDCTAAESRGGLVVDDRNPNWFARESGHPEFVVNDGWMPHPAFGTVLDHERTGFAFPDEAAWETYLDVLAGHGVNVLLEIPQLYARQDEAADPPLWPWPVVDDGPTFDVGTFDLEFYRRLDRRLERAADRGVFYGLELLFDNSTYREREWSNHPLNAANGGWLDVDGDTGFDAMFDLEGPHVEGLERYVEYTVARTSAHRSVFYALGAECGNLAPDRESAFVEWYDHWGDVVASTDPHGRLCTLGDTGDCLELARHRHNDLLVTQEHSSMDDLEAFADAVNELGERTWAHGRPTVVGEQDRANEARYDVERRGYWVALASGYAMGRVDRHYPVGDGDRLHESVAFDAEGAPPVYADLRRLRRFVEETGLPLWRMAPADGLLTTDDPVYCLADPGVDHLVYFARGGSARLALPDRRFDCRWYDPREGAFRDAGARRGETSFETPDGGDWALRVAR